MKKVLIISYYWPPSGGIGVHRCLKFAKYLRQFGWEPVVYTAKNPQYPYLDESNYKDIPEGITVLKHRIVEPFNAFKILTGKKISDPLSNPIHVREKKAGFFNKFAIWIRGNFFIPDARSLWIRPSVKFLSSYLENHKIDAILSDGPPHTNTYIAFKLARKFNLPWLADFQDPWTQVDYYSELLLTKWADRKHHRMEKEVFERANKITIASPTWKEELEAIGAKNVSVIYWGYDEDDFKIPERNPDEDHFIISHAGLLGLDRNPDILFKVLSEMIEEIPEFKSMLRIVLAGMVDFSVRKTIEDYGLNDFVEYTGNIPRETVLELNLKSSVLLLPLNKAKNAKGRIPGKLFEYLRSGRQILGFGPLDSDVSRILKETGRGSCVEYEDKAGIKTFIKSAYTLKSKSSVKDPKKEILSYTVFNQTKKIAGFLDEMVS